MKPSSSPSEPAPVPPPGPDRTAAAPHQRAGGDPEDQPGGLFDEVLARGPVRRTTSDRAWLQAMLDAEAALAGARADAGLTTPELAERVAAVCRADAFDPAVLGREAAAGGNPVIPLVRALTATVAADDEKRDMAGGSPGAADEVHRGATSQDIVDSAAMVVVQRSLGPLLGDLEAAADRAADLAHEHRQTPLAGRTLLQQATPLSFGLKAAGWMVALDDAADRLRHVRDHRLAAQLGGATGTLAGFGGRGVEVADRFAARLGLRSAVLAWHTDRNRLGDVATGLGLAGGVVGKVALDVVLLAQTEVGEVREGHPDRGGSSTMPHKRNPVAAVAARGAVLAAPGLVSTLLATMAQEHERAAGAWHSEWRVLTELLRAVGSGASWLADCLGHLQVDPVRMGRNLEVEGDLLLADRVAEALVPALGRITAHDLVAEVSRRAAESRRPLAQLLADDTRVGPHLGPTELAHLLDPSQALGESAVLVERALAHHRSRDTTRRGR